MGYVAIYHSVSTDQSRSNMNTFKGSTSPAHSRTGSSLLPDSFMMDLNHSSATTMTQATTHTTRSPLLPDTFITDSNPTQASTNRAPLLASVEDLQSSPHYLFPSHVSNNIPFPSGLRTGREMSSITEIGRLSQGEIMKLFSVMLNSASEVLSQHQNSELTSKLRNEALASHRQKAPYSLPVQYQKPRREGEQISPSKVVHC